MFPAAFLALLAPQLRRPGAPVAALAGAMIAVALLPFAPAGVPVIAALAGMVPGVLDLVAVPLLAALILVQTLGDGNRLALEPRVPALAVAAVLVWRRGPFLVVVLAAAGTAALLRALG